MSLFTSPSALLGLWNPWGRLALVGLTAAVFTLASAFPNFPGDEWALLQLQELQAPWLTDVGNVLSIIGGTRFAAALTVTVVILLWLLNRRAESLVVLLGGLFILGGIGLKLAVDRPRPDHYLVAYGPSLSSFPSGHALFAAIFCGITIVLIENWLQRPLLRRCLQAGLVLLVLVMGVSRVYLGFHWPSDVLGSYLYSAVVLVELICTRNRLVTWLGK